MFEYVFSSGGVPLTTSRHYRLTNGANLLPRMQPKALGQFVCSQRILLHQAHTGGRSAYLCHSNCFSVAGKANPQAPGLGGFAERELNCPRSENMFSEPSSRR